MNAKKIDSKEARNRRIAHEGSNYASKKHLQSKGSLEGVMQRIEEEIDSNEGIYPYNDGKITVDELLRRAGKSPAYLQKNTPKIKALKAEVNAWIKRIKGQIASGAPSVRREVNERVKKAKKEADEVRQAYAEAELELSRTVADLAKAKQTIGELEKQNTSLLMRLAGQTVVPFDLDQQK
jgi:chromosome segregation ATPase